MIGIPTRYDVNGLESSRRIGMNIRLKQLCKEKKVQYIEYECSRNRLWRDGLHLNETGQRELAKQIFDHCINFLE